MARGAVSFVALAVLLERPQLTAGETPLFSVSYWGVPIWVSFFSRSPSVGRSDAGGDKERPS